MLQGARRKLNLEQGTEEERFPFLHVGAWGPPKAGKTDFGLRIRSHEVWLLKPADPTNPFSDRVKLQLLLPSKPLSIAYANFDRTATSVLVNLPPDSDIIEEQFFRDEHGDPIFMPTKEQLGEQIARLGRFFEDAIHDKMDLLTLDGGTIVWDNVREYRLADIAPGGSDADGQPRLLARQYGPANTEMRQSIMQRLHGLPMHTVLTRESGEKWKSQNEVLRDAQGDAVLRADGWNKTGHYVDMDGQFRIIQTPQGGKRVYTPDVSIRPAQLGRTMDNPSFEHLYRLCYPQVPLIKRADIPLFEQLREEHGAANLAW